MVLQVAAVAAVERAKDARNRINGPQRAVQAWTHGQASAHDVLLSARFQKSGVLATGMGYSWSLNDCS